jgi:bla regulator protein BlaR1
MTLGRGPAVLLWIAFLTDIRAQNVPEWQVKAGGKASFEVASVKPFKPSKDTIPRPPNMNLANGDGKPAGGRFYSQFFGVSAYIGFAYKLAPGEAEEAFDHLPKWARETSFEIEANALGNPTKDKMRLMMQSLLADRFKLAIHFETREAPVLALELVEPGKPGPKLIPHSQGPPCPDEYVEMKIDPTRPPQPVDPRKDVFPQNCGEAPMTGRPDGTYYVGHRDTSMEVAAHDIYNYGVFAGEVDTPITDQTGLKGRYDYLIEYQSDAGPRLFKTQPAGSDPQGTPFLDAVRNQLGLKLVKTKGPVRTLVIDHIEMPSEN